MPNIPSKPVIQNQEWINGETKLNQTNLTAGVNTNITNLKTAVDGVIDALGGPGAAAPGGTKIYQHDIAGNAESDMTGRDVFFELTVYTTDSTPYTGSTLYLLFRSNAALFTKSYAITDEYIYNPILSYDGDGGYRIMGIGYGESTSWDLQLRTETLINLSNVHDTVTLM